MTEDLAGPATDWTLTALARALRARKVYPQYARLEALYTNTGITTRYSVEPVPWHLTTHTWEERSDIYQRNALDLLERVARQSIAEAGLTPRDIDIIVTNTITGLSIPSLEARLMNRLAFRARDAARIGFAAV